MKNTIQYKRRLNTLFRTSRLYSSDSQEEISSIYANLTCNIPQLTLYQYRRCSNHSFNAFSQNQLTLVNPLAITNWIQIVEKEIYQCAYEVFGDEYKKEYEATRDLDFLICRSCDII